MGERKGLPSNWNEMNADEQMMWMMDTYGTDEDDERGYMIFDTEAMPKEVYEAFKEITSLVY